ncbi:MAG: adenylate/guanylate cyclase domain-containing protein [Bacteroidales bacterium]
MDGENIKAVFGIPEPLSEAPVKVVGAASDLIERFKTFNEVKELPHPVHLRVGLETGPVIVSKVGKDEQSRYNVFGETVNTASRIRDFAEKGQILAGPNLYSKLKGQIEFFPLEPVPVKGQKEPLQVFELIRKKKKEIEPDTSTGRMITSEMVGRQAEFEILQNGVFNLINGKGSVINIIGKAGIGKSLLLAELRQKDLMKKVALFEGRAFSNGQNLSFHPITQIIKSWAGITEEDLTDVAVGKLESNIKRIYPEAFDEIFPFIATMMGYRMEGKVKERTKGIEGEALENLILKNLRDLLSRATTIRPVVIVIEDAHWCDISSIIFMESLYKLSRKNRILFVNIFRPGYQETGDRINKFLEENLKDYFTQINIESLKQNESDKLINNLLHQTNLPEEINRLIIERSAGNPFFIEEVIRSFIDEGLIEFKDNRFLLTENIQYANIPESIDHVILSRIERLDGNTKELLKTASVIGRNFYYKILEDAARNIEEIDNRLEYLKDVQLINERKQKDEVEFLFKHALAQQATYDSIMETTRKDLHLKIAGSIEKVFVGRIHEFYGMLAHHYSKAGQQEKAEEFLIKAGDESMKSGASSEAVNFLKKALEVHSENARKNPDRRKVVDLEEKFAFALYASGQHVEAVEYFDRVIAFYYKPFPKNRLRILLNLAYNLLLGLKIIYFYRRKGFGESGEIELKILKMIEPKGKALVSVNSKRTVESFYGFRFVSKKNFGNYEASLFLSAGSAFFYTGKMFKLGQKILETAEERIDPDYDLGILFINYARALQAFSAAKKFEVPDEEKIYKLGLQTGQYWPVTITYLFGGLNLIESGNKKLVLHYLDRMKTLSEEFDNDYPGVQYFRLKTNLYTKFRELDEATDIIKEAITITKNTDYKMQLLMAYCNCSIVFSLKQEFTEAKNALTQAEHFIKDFRIPMCQALYYIAKTHIEIAELKLNKRDLHLRKKVLKTTHDLVMIAHKVRSHLTESYRLHAVVYLLLNKPGKAFRNFEKSIKMGLSFNGNLELSRTYLEAGKFLRDPKNKKERINGMNGTECLMKAQAMFEEMDLPWI